MTRATVATRSATALTADLALEGTTAIARLQLKLDTPATLDVELSLDRPGVRRVREEFQDQQERVYGIWEYPFGGNLDNRGNDRPYLGFGRQTGSLYTSARAPFYLTSRRYGVYVRSSALGRFSIGVAGKTGFGFDGAGLRYTVIHGRDYYQLLERYTAIAGGAFMPPLWALGGVWWADDFHRDLRNAANAQDNVIDLATQLQSRRIRAAGLLVDRPFGTGFNGWGNMDWAPSFPDPPRMVADLRARGLELVLWIANRAWNNLYVEGRAQGLLFPGSDNLGPAADLRLPAAEAWWKAKLAPFVDLGVKGYKIDRGEQNEHPDCGPDRQRHPLRAAGPGEPGRPARQRGLRVRPQRGRHRPQAHRRLERGLRGQLHRPGLLHRRRPAQRSDRDADVGLGHRRLPAQRHHAQRGGVRPLAGLLGVFADDGGAGRRRPHALVRLLAGAGGHRPQARRRPPRSDPVRAVATCTPRWPAGAPVMRPLLLELPDDARVANTWDQYLFGAELLVAPVVTAGATSRTVFLPPGRWLDYNGRRQVAQAGAQGAMFEAPAPLDTIPVFVREGAIVPRGDLFAATTTGRPTGARGCGWRSSPARDRSRAASCTSPARAR